MLVDRVESGTAVLVTAVVASMLSLIAGESLPKAYGLGQARTFALRVVRPLRYVGPVLYPAIAVFDLLTRAVLTRIGGQQLIERTYDEVE